MPPPERRRPRRQRARAYLFLRNAFSFLGPVVFAQRVALRRTNELLSVAGSSTAPMAALILRAGVGSAGASSSLPTQLEQPRVRPAWRFEDNARSPRPQCRAISAEPRRSRGAARRVVAGARADGSFSTLTASLEAAWGKLRFVETLTEENVKEPMRDIRRALLEADVSLPVVRRFVKRVEAAAVGVKVTAGVRPDQQASARASRHAARSPAPRSSSRWWLMSWCS